MKSRTSYGAARLPQLLEMSRMSELAADLYHDGLPGWKEPTTSRDAAHAMRGRSATLRDKILELLKHHAGLTPDEASELLGETVLAIRPRFTELSKMDLIETTGEKRANVSGMKAKIYRVKGTI